MEDRYLRSGEAARYLGIARSYLAHLRREGRGPHAYYPAGGHPRYLLSELDAWARGQTPLPPPPASAVEAAG